MSPPLVACQCWHQFSKTSRVAGHTERSRLARLAAARLKYGSVVIGSSCIHLFFGGHFICFFIFVSLFYGWSTKPPLRRGKKKTKNTVSDSFFHSPATWHVKGFPQKTGNSEFRGCFVFRMIRKIYKLVALSCNRGDTAEPSPRPMSNPRVVFLCYGLWQETRPHTKKTKIKKGLKKDHVCFYKQTYIFKFWRMIIC